MWCIKCDHDLGSCVCPDLQERLQALAGPQGSHVALSYCSGCGEYYARCKCPDPKPTLEMRNMGRIIGTPKRPKKERRK